MCPLRRSPGERCGRGGDNSGQSPSKPAVAEQKTEDCDKHIPLTVGKDSLGIPWLWVKLDELPSSGASHLSARTLIRKNPAGFRPLRTQRVSRFSLCVTPFFHKTSSVIKTWTILANENKDS